MVRAYQFSLPGASWHRLWKRPNPRASLWSATCRLNSPPQKRSDRPLLYCKEANLDYRLGNGRGAEASAGGMREDASTPAPRDVPKF